MNLLTRYGTEHTGSYQAGDKPYFTQQRACGRCGGAGGGEQWRHTGWTCYQCGGSGRGPVETVRLYTQEQLDKLNATQAKREATKLAKDAAKQAAKQAEIESRRGGFMLEHGEYLERVSKALNADTFAQELISTATTKLILSDRMREVLNEKMAKLEENAGIKPLGNAGERREFAGTVERIINLESSGPWAAPSIYIIRTVDGGVVKYKGTGFLGSKGDAVSFKATVDGHEAYNGVTQTIVSRPKLSSAAA